jgi:glycosyltransferase involved in cell wall biosynthesis
LNKQRVPGKQKHVRSVVPFVRFSGTPKVSVIIPVFNEVKTLSHVIRQAFLVHRKTEVIIVANGTTDGSQRTAARLGARVMSIDEPLGHDVGRSIGANAAKGDILLFLDGDFIIPASRLRPLIKAVISGVDVALNSYSGKASASKVHKVTLSKYALNTILAHRHLHGASMTTVPHAISRKALRAIGAENLAVPPLAQTIAAQKGLKLKAVHFIHVGMRNPIRRISKGVDPLGDVIVGDHLEAIHWLIQNTGERGNMPDLIRKRLTVR